MSLRLVDELRQKAFEMSPGDQYRLAFFIAENLGMVLVNEPEHPDSPHHMPSPQGSVDRG